jgi:hypothetical protein
MQLTTLFTAALAIILKEFHLCSAGLAFYFKDITRPPKLCISSWAFHNLYRNLKLKLPVWRHMNNTPPSNIKKAISPTIVSITGSVETG